MRWPWQKERDPRPPAEVDLDLEFDRTRRTLLSTLDELQEQVERAQWMEAARERQDQQRRAQPGTA